MGVSLLKIKRGSIYEMVKIGIFLLAYTSSLVVGKVGSDSCKLPPVSSKYNCPTYSYHQYSIPSISEETSNHNVSKIPYHLTKTRSGIAYVFPTGVQENCLKPVTQFGFCYVYVKGPNSEDGPNNIFDIVSLIPHTIPDGSLLFSRASMETVRGNKTTNQCSSLSGSNEILCCGTFIPNNFFLSSFAAVSVESGSQLLMYNTLSQNSEFSVPQYIIGSDLGGVLSADFCTRTIEEKGLLVLKFFFDNSTCLGTCTSSTTEVTVPVDNTATLAGATRDLPLPIIIGASAATLVVVMTVLTLIAVGCFIVKRYRRSSVPILETHFSNAFENSIYGIQQQDEEAELHLKSQSIVAESAYDEIDDTVKENSHTLDPSRDKEEDYVCPAKDEEGLYSQLQNMTIAPNRSSVKLGDLLGSGQFGAVYKGTWNRRGSKGIIDVAVKTLKERASCEDKVKFLQEAAIMGQFKHPNIVNMYGIVTDGEPILLILELLDRGDLRKHLLTSKSGEVGSATVDGHSLLSYCRQVAAGMVYLSNKGFVHRDLAARNILVSEDDTCKISDFGMSRDLADESYYMSQGGKIPVKWTAPEALYYKKYSTASDVWSYGVVMYEIWSLGHKPFEELKNAEVMKLLDTGYRLPPPPGCSRSVYSIMISCWHPDTCQRSTFEFISQQICISDTKLLQWTPVDISVHPEAGRLGAELENSKKLYPDLQETYKQ